MNRSIGRCVPRGLARQAEVEREAAVAQVDTLTEELAVERAQWKKRGMREQEQNAARETQVHGELSTKVRRFYHSA